MLGLSSREKKVTVAYHLPEWLVRVIEQRAIARGTNKSHEAAKAIRAGIEHEPDAVDASAATAPTDTTEDAPLAIVG